MNFICCSMNQHSYTCLIRHHYPIFHAQYLTHTESMKIHIRCSTLLTVATILATQQLERGSSLIVFLKLIDYSLKPLHAFTGNTNVPPIDISIPIRLLFYINPFLCEGCFSLLFCMRTPHMCCKYNINCLARSKVIKLFFMTACKGKTGGC